MFGIVILGLFFHGADNDAGGEKFSAKSFGEFDALGVFAGHRKAENINATSAEPCFDCFNFVVHGTIIALFGGLWLISTVD